MPTSLSLVTVTYNAALYLPDLINSVRQQTDRDFAWIVVDGASTDGTKDLLVSATDVVTCLISEPDFGIYDAMNKALRLVTSEYYLVLGADDRLFPEAITLYRNKASETKADIITASVAWGKKVKTPGPHRFKLNRGIWSILTSHSVGCLIRRSLHDTLGYYSHRYPLIADTDFLMRAYNNNATLGQLDNVVGAYGITGISSTDKLAVATEYLVMQVKSGKSLLVEVCRFVVWVLIWNGHIRRNAKPLSKRRIPCHSRMLLDK
jgi:glycosyltransferase involved in cell wall biosynthesis